MAPPPSEPTQAFLALLRGNCLACSGAAWGPLRAKHHTPPSAPCIPGPPEDSCPVRMTSPPAGWKAAGGGGCAGRVSTARGAQKRQGFDKGAPRPEPTWRGLAPGSAPGTHLCGSRRAQSVKDAPGLPAGGGPPALPRGRAAPGSQRQEHLDRGRRPAVSSFNCALPTRVLCPTVHLTLSTSVCLSH